MTKAVRMIVVPPVMLLMIVFTLIIGANLSKSKHSEANLIRNAYQNEACEGVEIYFSPRLGTLLVLCGLPDSNLTGGLIYRISENYGHSLLGQDSYEVTVFAAKRLYWDNVLVRDEYLPIAAFPDIERRLKEWFIK